MTDCLNMELSLGFPYSKNIPITCYKGTEGGEV